MMQSNAGQQSHPEIRKENQPQLFTLVLNDDNNQTYKRILFALIVNWEQQRVELLYLYVISLGSIEGVHGLSYSTDG